MIFARSSLQHLVRPTLCDYLCAYRSLFSRNDGSCVHTTTVAAIERFHRDSPMFFNNRCLMRTLPFSSNVSFPCFTEIFARVDWDSVISWNWKAGRKQKWMLVLLTALLFAKLLNNGFLRIYILNFTSRAFHLSSN